MSFDSLNLQTHVTIVTISINNQLSDMIDGLDEDQLEHGRVVLAALADWIRAVAEDPESNDARFHQARVTTLATLHKGLYISR